MVESEKGSSVWWKSVAWQSFQDTIDYLYENWPFRVVEEFVSRTGSVVENIKINPKRYRMSEYGNLREAIVHPNCLLIYRIADHWEVELLVFFDTRQNPAKKGLYYGKL